MITIIPIEPLSDEHGMLIIEAFNRFFVDKGGQEDGDGAGYDIASFTPEGGTRLVEVKTTNGWERSAFHISRNELEVANDNRHSWRLVRVWNFARQPRAFELAPPLDAHVSLTPTSFLARFG